MPVSYPREMRKKAKDKGTALVTIDTPSMQIQTPAATPEMVKELQGLMLKWIKRKRV